MEERGTHPQAGNSLRYLPPAPPPPPPRPSPPRESVRADVSSLLVSRDFIYARLRNPVIQG